MKNQRASKLPGRENEDSWKYNNATSSYNQVYADAPLSRQLKDEESKQRVDALVKKRELANNRRKSLSNSHSMLNPHEHEQST